MVLRYFPMLYPDETLYSAFSRYSKLSSVDFKTAIRDLFDTDSLVASWEFPSHLNRFISNLYSSYDADDVIFMNTMLPLYFPFLDNDRREYALSQMKSDNGKGIYMKLGVMASKIKGSCNLKFCPSCMQDDIKIYGEPYWHRSHNAHGVTMCYIHGVELSVMCPICFEIQAKRRKNLFSALHKKCSKGHDLTRSNGFPNEKTETYEKEMLIAQATHYLLNNRLESFCHQDIFNKYRYLLSERGLVIVKSGHIRQKDFIEEFTQHYSQDFLKSLGLGINKEAKFNWLTDMMLRPQKMSHPIKHILLIQFLSQDITEFFNNTKSEYYPFGEGPWLCLNPVADHYRDPIVRNMKLTIDSKTRKPVGTFKCDCGFTYSRRGEDTCSEDRYRIGRIKEFGFVWETELKEVLLNKGGSLRSIAESMNVDPNTIKKYASKLGIQQTWESKAAENEIGKEDSYKIVSRDMQSQLDMDLEKKHIQSLKSFILENEGVTRTEVRKKFMKEYAWLYRHNKERLFSVLPKTNLKNSNMKEYRVDWEKRDNEIYEKVKQEIDRIQASCTKERVTVSRIGKNLGLLCILEQHLDKLPRTNDLIQRSYETVDDFQIRRLKLLIPLIRSEDGIVRTWRLFRKAGLKSNCTEYVKKKIDQMVNDS